MGDGGVPRDGRVDDGHVRLARDRTAAVVGAIRVERGSDHRDVAVEGEDGTARAVRGAAVEGGVDDGHVAVLVRVDRSPIAVGRVPVDVGPDHDHVAGRSDRTAGSVDEVAAQNGVDDPDAAAAGVDRAAVVVREVARQDRADHRRPPHREDAAPGLLGEVLRDLRVDDRDLSPRRHRGPRTVAAPAGQPDVAEAHEAGPVLPQNPALETGLPDHVPVAVQLDRPLGLADRVAATAAVQRDVGGQLDPRCPRVGPGGPQLALVGDGADDSRLRFPRFTPDRERDQCHTQGRYPPDHRPAEPILHPTGIAPRTRRDAGSAPERLRHPAPRVPQLLGPSLDRPRRRCEIAAGGTAPTRERTQG